MHLTQQYSKLHVICESNIAMHKIERKLYILTEKTTFITSTYRRQTRKLTLVDRAIRFTCRLIDGSSETKLVFQTYLFMKGSSSAELGGILAFVGSWKVPNTE